MTGAKARWRSRPGFTLIELLVVAAVFSLTFLIGTTVFTTTQRIQRQTLARQRVVADGRYVLEAIARTVRQTSIDYAYYQSRSLNLSNPQSILATKDASGASNCYRLQGDLVEQATDCANWSDAVAITPDDLTIRNFFVYIRPRSNPYALPPVQSSDCRVAPPVAGVEGYDQAIGACLCVDSTDCYDDQRCVTTAGTKTCQNATTQPHITLFIRSASLDAESEQPVELRFQTTVVSRVYGR